jgi:signal peptidase I
MSRTRERAAIAAATLVVGALLLLFWPATLGGATGYVTTRGTSMEPGIRQGDLVFVRERPSYDVGDVVAFRSAELGTTVLHRIVDRDGDRFVTKGDNNDFLDLDDPGPGDVIGRQWLRIPGGGRLLGAARISLPLLAGGLTMLGTREVRRRRGGRSRPAHLAPSPPRPSALHIWRTTTLVAGGTFLACAALAALAFGRPASTTAAERTAYTQRGEFSYGAPAPPGAAYPDGRVDPGEPVFLRLVDGLDVAFDYDFEAGAPARVEGSLGVVAVISDATGWRHEIELQPARPFADDDARAEVHLDVREVEAVVAEMAATTGIQGGSPTVAIVPRVTADAQVGGQAVDATFAPELRFSLQPLQLQLLPGDGDADVLAPVAAGSLERSTVRTNDLEAFGVGVPVGAARAAAVGLGAPALVVAAAGALVLRRRLEREDARIELRHGHRMVPVSGARSDVIEIGSIEDLARIAEQYQGLILHRQTSRGHDYALQVDGVVYRYSTRS